MGWKWFFRSVLSILFTGSNNQFWNYESQFLRFFFICTKFYLFICNFFFRPKKLIKSDNSGFGFSELVFRSDKQYIHLQHNSNLNKTDKKISWKWKCKEIRIHLLKWFQLIVCQIRKLPNKWAWNVTYLTWWLRTWEPCLFHCSDGHLEYKKCREQYPLQLC